MVKKKRVSNYWEMPTQKASFSGDAQLSILANRVYHTCRAVQMLLSHRKYLVAQKEFLHALAYAAGI
jgi:hypothetical protein